MALLYGTKTHSLYNYFLMSCIIVTSTTNQELHIIIAYTINNDKYSWGLYYTVQYHVTNSASMITKVEGRVDFELLTDNSYQVLTVWPEGISFKYFSENVRVTSLRCLISWAALFLFRLIRDNSKETIERYWPFVLGIHRYLVDFPQIWTIMRQLVPWLHNHCTYT